MTTRITMHKAREEMLEQAKAFIHSTTKKGAQTSGVVGRCSMQSRTDPLEFVNVTFWKYKEILDTFLRTRMAEATKPDSPWAWIDGGEYDVSIIKPLTVES